MQSTTRSPLSRFVAVALGITAVLGGFAAVARAGDELSTAPSPELVAQDYDPWAGFNERMFSFNHSVLDRLVVKPAATAWDKVCPDVAKRGVGRAIDNLKMPQRLVNDMLQGRVTDAGTEVGRFVVNTTAGVGGFVDVAARLHLEPNEADMGETLGVWGVGAGPYLVLPFLAPLTVRDGVGRAVDAVLDPLWLVPFFGGTVMNLVDTVNERSLHLRLFADVEESSLDLYSAVRNGYLQRRRQAIAERRWHVAPVTRLFTWPSEGKGRDA
jgi:phospholipid-binding lipoprotein MlaA